MTYGLPYKGSKNSIAKWVVDNLPPADVFVDLFAGGCAVTHAAMLSGKYKRIIANDISGSPYIFREAIHGDFDGFATVPDREGFFMSDDLALKLLYSFGNDGTSYLWGEEYEKLKVPAGRMLSAPSMHERRFYYRQFMKELAKFVRDIVEGRKEQPTRMERHQGLEAVNRLQGLERAERLTQLKDLPDLELMVADYRNVNIPDGAVVYADPPYKNTGEQYGGFNHDAFEEWLATVNHPVYISEYDAPRGCSCIAERIRHVHMDYRNPGKKAEKIFIQERYADTAIKKEGS